MRARQSAEWVLVVVAGVLAAGCGGGNGAVDAADGGPAPDGPAQPDAGSPDADPDGADAPEDATPPPDAPADTPDPGDAGGCPAALFHEDFEAYAAGDPLAAGWQLVVQGPNSSARINVDAEGHGNGGSNRYVLFTNAGSYPDSVQISAATPPRDVRGCSRVVLFAGIIVFSLEVSENDQAFVEVRGNGSDWSTLYMPFPSPDFPENASCRAGGQETGCVAWRTIQIELPPAVLGADLEVRFRSASLTTVSDFFAFDDVTLTGFP